MSEVASFLRIVARLLLVVVCNGFSSGYGTNIRNREDLI
jgi:hypothetical protein